MQSFETKLKIKIDTLFHREKYFWSCHFFTSLRNFFYQICVRDLPCPGPCRRCRWGAPHCRSAGCPFRTRVPTHLGRLIAVERTRRDGPKHQYSVRPMWSTPESRNAIRAQLTAPPAPSDGRPPHRLRSTMEIGWRQTHQETSALHIFRSSSEFFVLILICPLFPVGYWDFQVIRSRWGLCVVNYVILTTCLPSAASWRTWKSAEWT